MGVGTTSCALPPVSLASTSTGESPRDEESEKASLLPTKDRGSGAVWSPLLYLFFWLQLQLVGRVRALRNLSLLPFFRPLGPLFGTSTVYLILVPEPGVNQPNPWRLLKDFLLFKYSHWSQTEEDDVTYVNLYPASASVLEVRDFPKQKPGKDWHK